jgi:hypothetical protein
MKRRNFIGLTAAGALSVIGCGQKEQPRYDPKECPFCKDNPGKCLYCGGNGKCSFCQGTGKRNAQTIANESEKVKKITIPGECPFCGGTGKCHYCKGQGACSTCKGTGKLEEWK